MSTVLRMMSGTVFIRPVGKPVPVATPEPGHAFWGLPIGGPTEMVLVETRFEIVPMENPNTKQIEPQPVDIVMCKIEQFCAARKITPSGRDAFSAFRVARPSRPGIMTSSRTTSGASVCFIEASSSSPRV